MVEFADVPFGELVKAVAADDPVPGAGPSLAWTCAVAAALVEMVSAVSLRKQPEHPGAIQARRDRAVELRLAALSLAGVDAEASRGVLAVGRRRDEPGHPRRLRQALADAADPLVSIIETAGEVTRLAAEALGDARGGVRGEAIVAATLAAAVMRAGAPLVELNLASAPDDPRRARVRDAALAADNEVKRALGARVPARAPAPAGRAPDA